MGRAVAPLRDEGVLLFGSGLSYHSMPGFSRNGQASHASSESKACLCASLSRPSVEPFVNGTGMLVACAGFRAVHGAVARGTCEHVAEAARSELCLYPAGV